MKNIIKYAIALVAAGAVMASCDINKPDIFDDDNAFVAFDKGTMSITEAAGAKLSIPVTLASVAGIEESVSFKVVDGTAVAGTNFELLTVSGVLNFDAENRTQYIEFEILPDGKFTGDITFSVEFANTGSVQAGAENKCTVTIMDSDHPFSAVLGTYSVTGISGRAGGEATWTASISADPSDINRLLLTDFVDLGGSGLEGALVYYGTIDDEMTTITIPIGQTATFSGTDFYLWGMDASEADIETGTITVTILKDGDTVTGLDFGDTMGIEVVVTEGPNAGYWGFVYPGITATKD